MDFLNFVLPVKVVGCIKSVLSPEGCFTGGHFVNFVNKLHIVDPTAFMDVCVYRVTKDHKFTIPVRRMIATNVIVPAPEFDLRVLSNNHMKFYNIYRKNRLWRVAVGSLNFVNPTLLETMVFVHKSQAGYYKTLFKSLWKQTQPHAP